MSEDIQPIPRWPPGSGSEIDTLIGSLERQRRTFAWKCGDLDAAGLRARTAATTMTLGGLLMHLALVEADYFSVKLLGQDPGPPWNTVDWEADPGWEWRTAAEDPPEQLYTLWADSGDRARANLTVALADGDAARLAQLTWPDGQSPSIRRLLGRPDRGVSPAHRPRRPAARGPRRLGGRGSAATMMGQPPMLSRSAMARSPADLELRNIHHPLPKEYRGHG